MKRITQFILCLVLAVSGYGQGVGGNSVPRTVSGISNALDLISSTQGSVFYRGASGWEALTPGTSGQLLSTQGAAANPIWVTATGGAGDMNGPASATDNAIVRFDGTGGKTVQNSPVTIADTTGAMTWATGQSATLTGGDLGASLVLGSGATLSTLTSTGVNQWFLISNTAASNGYAFRTARQGTTLGIYHTTASAALGTVSNHPLDFFTFDGSTALRLTTTGNLLIGTTTDMGGVTGGVKIASTNASTNSTSGALQVAGGIYAGAASVFGSTVNVTGAATFAGAVSVSGTAATWTSGTGSPESVQTAPVGSLYTRTDGGASTTLYVKESGAGNTGWVAK